MPIPEPSPCRYPVPLAKYGNKKPCKNGVKDPCVPVSECWAKAGGDVIKSINCQQEYVRDLASYLFKADKVFRNAWLSHVASYDLRDYDRRKNYSKNDMEAFSRRKAEYNSGVNVTADNGVTRFAEQQLDMLIAGDRVRSLNSIAAFRNGVITELKKAFSGLFTFKNGKIDFETPAAGKLCTDIAPYYTFIYNVNLLLTEGTKTHGGRKSRKSGTQRRRRSTRRN